MAVKQYMLTPAAGKRLIGKALAVHPEIKRALASNTIVIIAGTTNSYAADEILGTIGETSNLVHGRFFRGITLPPGYKVSATGRLVGDTRFPGDVVIRNGVWLKGNTIFDVADDLKEGDIVVKGANALDLAQKRAAILIGDSRGGTSAAIIPAIVGRRVRLILPVGLEKRITGNLDDLANKINAPGIEGYRFLPVEGEVFTEIEALSLLTGVTSEIFAAGGVGGAEGGIWLAVNGTAEEEQEAEKVLKTVAAEPMFNVYGEVKE